MGLGRVVGFMRARLEAISKELFLLVIQDGSSLSVQPLHIFGQAAERNLALLKSDDYRIHRCWHCFASGS